MTLRVAPVQPRDLREAFRLSRERLARLIGVSAKTVERWEARPTQPARGETRARMAQLREIAELGEAVYTRDGLAAFLNAPLAEFDGLTALQLMERDEAPRVLAALASDYEGAGY
ncbi:MAG TPA: helix-turn-helix transcriptional regulator [Methylomirabilota bacterium]|nr:helix-turn-helix transcriptional regulator [Methylomirabilota bacterium]